MFGQNDNGASQKFQEKNKMVSEDVEKLSPAEKAVAALNKLLLWHLENSPELFGNRNLKNEKLRPDFLYLMWQAGRERLRTYTVDDSEKLYPFLAIDLTSSETSFSKDLQKLGILLQKDTHASCKFRGSRVYSATTESTEIIRNIPEKVEQILLTKNIIEDKIDLQEIPPKKNTRMKLFEWFKSAVQEKPQSQSAEMRMTTYKETHADNQVMNAKVINTEEEHRQALKLVREHNPQPAGPKPYTMS